MAVRTLLVGVRCSLLLLVAGWLAVSIATRVLADHPADRRALDLDDQGIRVLLTDPAPGALDAAEPVDPAAWSQVNLTVRWRALLYCPDDPEGGPNLHLSEGARVRIIANNQSGLTISSTSELEEEPQTWNYQEIRLVPYPDDLPPELRAADAIARDDIEAPGGAPLFAIDGKDYRGTLSVRRAAWKRLRVVNALPLVAWLDGVLQAEAAASWPPEALKALAIVCRSNAFVARIRGGEEADGLVYHLDDREPAYRGTGAGGERIRAALVATRGQILTYLGQPFAPPYHLSSGGYLASVEAVFPGGATTVDGTSLADVMPADRDPWCQAGARAVDAETCWEQETIFNGDNIKKATDRVYAGRDIGWVHRIEVEGGILGPQEELRRVRTVRLVWYGGSMELPAETFRELLAQDPETPVHLPSCLWTKDSPKSIESIKDKQTWRIVSYGKGHGVGMSLVSAYRMASLEPPMPAAEILGFFYKQALIDTMDRFEADRAAE